MFDLVIRNGRIIDGSGSLGFNADIAVKDGKIALIGRVAADAEAERTIDAAGLTVTPGFIDIHRHADAAAFRPDFGEAELHQGLTTIVNGNCGLSIAPVSGVYKPEIDAYLYPITGSIDKSIPTASMGEYLGALKDIPVNIGMLAGAGTIRADAAGYRTTTLSDENYRTVHNSLEKALEDGALGISLGMGYAPECFYTTEELIRALEPVRNTDIPVTVHMRQEGSGVIESIEEMLEVARKLNCPMHISHLKAMGKENHGKLIPRALELIENALNEGMDVGCDVYPYTAGSTQLMHILPPEFLAGGIDATVERLKNPAARRELGEMIERKRKAEGAFDNIAALAGWDGIILTTIGSEKNKCYQGKSITEIAKMRASAPLDACCDLLAEEHCRITMIDFITSEDDIIRILKAPFSNLISDSTYPTEGMLHPRVYGTFTRMIEHFVKEKQAVSLEEAVNRMTYRAAKVLHLEGKGIIREGADADICIFDPTKLHECAGYVNPDRTSEGMSYVIVNGKIALEHEIKSKVNAGKVIRRV